MDNNIKVEQNIDQNIDQDVEKVELLKVLRKIGRINHKFCPHHAIPPGEFMMLVTIETNMKDRDKLNTKETNTKETSTKVISKQKTNTQETRNKESKTKVPGIKVSDLSDILHATKPATSKMIRNIEEKGLVERIADDLDRRIVYIALTPKGKETLEIVKKQSNTFLDNVIARLGQDDTQELIRIFNNLYYIMKDEYGNLKEESNKSET